MGEKDAKSGAVVKIDPLIAVAGKDEAGAAEAFLPQLGHEGPGIGVLMLAGAVDGNGSAVADGGYGELGDIEVNGGAIGGKAAEDETADAAGPEDSFHAAGAFGEVIKRKDFHAISVIRRGLFEEMNADGQVGIFPILAFGKHTDHGDGSLLLGRFFGAQAEHKLGDGGVGGVAQFAGGGLNFTAGFGIDLFFIAEGHGNGSGSVAGGFGDCAEGDPFGLGALILGSIHFND